MNHAELIKQLEPHQLVEFYENHLRNIDNKFRLIMHPDMGGLLQVDIITSEQGAEVLEFYRKIIEKNIKKWKRVNTKSLKSRS